ncbi:MAG TPA: cache domain-containing protein [Anaerolineae bacterium]|nr:cache domain-containing protein [Anaerolineae bacterium]
MSLGLANDILQGIGWFLALLELIMALYVLLFNPWHTDNRHLSGLLLLFALNSLGYGLLVQATGVSQAGVATLLLSLTTESIKVGMALLTVVLLRPDWLRGRWRWLWRLLYALVGLPMVLTLLDWVGNLGLWYTGLDPQIYQGGYVDSAAYLRGVLYPYFRPVYGYGIVFLTLVIQVYLVFVEKTLAPPRRRLAQFLLGGQLTISALWFLLLAPIAPMLSIALSNALFAFLYAYVALQQMISERRLQRGPLQIRLTTLILASAVPMLCAGLVFVNLQARAAILQSAAAELAANNRTLSANITLWLDDHVKFLQQLATQPQIVAMDAQKQRPLLESLQEIYPAMDLICTLDIQGYTIARSDGQAAQMFGDRQWFIAAREGAPATSQVFYRVSGQPALAVAVPIREPAGQVIGVAMFAMDLSVLAESLRLPDLSRVAQAYVVDDQNLVVVHSDPTYTAALRDLSGTAPIVALRNHVAGVFEFTDEQSVAWVSHLTLLPNGWGVVTRQTTTTLHSPLRRLGGLTLLIVVSASVIVSVLTFFTIRQSLKPVVTLTDAARAIVHGDLYGVASVEAEDELGELAHTFNQMTAQMRETMAALEQRVAARTHDLERHSGYLAASAEVGRAVASILDSEQLLRQVTDLIRERFDLYYVGLFLVDAVGEWAVLQAGTGAGGRAMLARNYRIRLGEGMIGWCIVNAAARVASHTESDFVWLAASELPDTQSEAALPLISRGQVLGALSVQSAQVDVFDADTVTVLQTVADLVAMAIDNARLFAEAQEALAAERRAYGARAREAWAELTRARVGLGYRCAPQETGGDAALTPVSDAWDSEMRQAQRTGQYALRATETGSVLAIPIRSGNEVIGVLRFEKAEAGAFWSNEETALLETLSDQLGQTLERARLYQETQRRAVREQLTREITDEMRRTLNWEELMQVAVQEMRSVLSASRAFVQWTAVDTVGSGAGTLREEARDV